MKSVMFLKVSSFCSVLHYRTKMVVNVQVKVSLRTVFLKVGAIDTIHDRFTAEALVVARWREPAFDGKKVVRFETDCVSVPYH